MDCSSGDGPCGLNEGALALGRFPDTVPRDCGVEPGQRTETGPEDSHLESGPRSYPALVLD